MADYRHEHLSAVTHNAAHRRYQSALRHFQCAWDGALPTSPGHVAAYLSDYANALTLNALKQRLAALSQWHIEQEHADPTRDPIVHAVLADIRGKAKALHGNQAP